MDVEFCIVAVEKAMARYGWPDIFNTDQGSQFTSGQGEHFTFALRAIARTQTNCKRHGLSRGRSSDGDGAASDLQGGGERNSPALESTASISPLAFQPD